MSVATGELLAARTSRRSEATSRLRAATLRPFLLPAVAAAVAVLVHLLLFRYGSADNDEVVYLTQARLISHGHLLLPADPTVQPWFFAPGPHGLVPKYLPTVGAWLGLSQLIFGSVTPALAAAAAGLSLVVRRLAGQILQPGRGAVAAWVVMLSPLTMLQSGLVLSYIPFLVVLCAVWSLLLDLAREDRRSGGVLARGAAIGFLAVVAAATRPYDTVLLLAPAALIVGRRLGRPRLLRSLAGVVAGAVPPGVAVLAYNAYATGSALKLPFGMLEPQDKVGFGFRKLVPEDPGRSFGPLQGLEGLAVHFVLAPLTWFALGLLLLPLAVLRVRRWRSLEVGARLLAASTGLFLVGYFIFWGPWNASLIWGGPRLIGPFYALALLPAVVILALDGVPASRLLARPRPRPRSWGRPSAVVAIVAAVATLAQLGYVVARAQVDDGRTETILGALGAARQGQDLTLINGDTPYLGHPVSALSDDTDAGAAGSAPLRLVGVVPWAAVDGRRVSLLQATHDPYLGREADVVVSRETGVSGNPLRLLVQPVGYDGDGPGTVVVSYGSRLVACAGGAGRDAAVPVLLDATGSVFCPAGPGDARLLENIAGTYRACSHADCLRLTYAIGRRLRAWRGLPTAVRDGRVHALVDGRQVLDRGQGWLTVTAGG